MNLSKAANSFAAFGALFFLFSTPGPAQGQAVPPAAPDAARALPAFPVTPNSTLVSPEISADGHVTFRLYAPGAQEVIVRSEGMPPGVPAGLAKAENGVWSVTVGPMKPGVYRYTFTVDGLLAIDMRNPDVSESLNNVQSVFEVPGADWMSMKSDVPHGSVETVWYSSSALGTMRRMHVYLPPGYDANAQRYPVFYLLHGAGDNDDAWTSVGHANFIVDNLIASGKAKPMIIVMPAGHTSRDFAFGGSLPDQNPFINDFQKDVMPYVEKHYRVIADRQHRAIAGLSMGGLQTLEISLANLDQYAYVGVFSSGFFNGADDQFMKEHGAALDNAAWKKGLKLFYVAVGSSDPLAYQPEQKAVGMLKAHGFTVDEHISDGGHTWINWRNYLVEFAPSLFQ